MGKLNKFALAPGSLSDIGAAGASVSQPASSDQSNAEDAPKPKPAKKKAAPKKKAEEAPAEEAAAAAPADQAEAAVENADAALLAEAGGSGELTAQELQLAAGDLQGAM